MPGDEVDLETIRKQLTEVGYDVTFSTGEMTPDVAADVAARLDSAERVLALAQGPWVELMHRYYFACREGRYADAGQFRLAADSYRASPAYQRALDAVVQIHIFDLAPAIIIQTRKAKS